MPDLTISQSWVKLRDQTAEEPGNRFSDALGPLLAATIGSPLESLTPFTSVSRLCFDASGGFPFEGLQPVFLEVMSDAQYWVFNASPYDRERIAELQAAGQFVSTHDPSTAVRAAEEFLGLTKGLA